MRCDLSGANLVNANLIEAFLVGANLGRADLSGADLNRATIGATLFGDCDLSLVKNLDKAKHHSSSTVGIDTIYRSRGNIPDVFLLGAGVQEPFIRGLPNLLGDIKSHSAFVAYGAPDNDFAERLHRDLTTKYRLNAWTHTMDYTPGEETWKEIKQKRQEAGKFIVLCSASGLLRDGLLKEIEEQTDEDEDKIVPISLDNIWKACGFSVKRCSRDLKPFLLRRNYVNLEVGQDYEKELQRLLKALELKKG